MRRYIGFILALLLPLSAQSIKAGYDVSFGLIGEIGKAEITYSHDEDSYTIYVHAWTTGMPALLTQNREEDYISQGSIIDGVLRPDVFVKYRKNDNYTKSNVHIFDYENKKVISHYAKEHKVHGTRFDTATMKNVKEETTEFENSEDIFRFFTDNDLLSLFFNTQKILPSLKEGDSKKLAAIGSKSPNCEIDIEVPTQQLRQELTAIMGDVDGQLLTIILHQNIFQSERGELHVNFDNDGFAKDVLLKDVIMFGDIRGKRIYQTLSSN
jgi:hypothetical protein